MSLYDRLTPPEPDYSDDEWERAEQLLIEERIELGWSETESRVAVDDLMIADKVQELRDARLWDLADEDRARRKEDR